MQNCTVDCIEIHGHLNLTQMCSYTQQQCLQDTVQFIQAYFCIIKESFIIMMILAVVFLYLLFSLINYINDNYLTTTVQQFIEDFKISPTLAGVTFLAFANGAPDVLTAIIAGQSDSSSTALIPFGSIFGAGLFSTSFILSTVIRSQKDEALDIQRRKILIPLIFYITGIGILMITSLFYHKMNIGIALSLFILYIIFIFIQLRQQHQQRKLKRQMEALDTVLIQSTSSNHEELREKGLQINSDRIQSQITDPLEKGENTPNNVLDRINDFLDGIYSMIFGYLIPPYSTKQWNSPLKIIVSIIVSPIGLAFTQQLPDIFYQKAFDDDEGNGGVPVFLLMSIPAMLLLIYSIFMLFIKKKQPKSMRIFAIYSFLVVIGWLSILCAILINLIELIQLLTKINSVFLGLTVLAWANCLGDYLSIVKFAKEGNAQTAVAGIFCGQLFNFLIGFGVILTTQSISNGTYEFDIFKFNGNNTYESLSQSIALLVICFGSFYLVCLLIRLIKSNNPKLGKNDGFLTKSYYIVFLLVALILTIIADLFYEISCDISTMQM